MVQQSKSKKRLFTPRYIYTSFYFIASTLSAIAITWKSLEGLNALNKSWSLPVFALVSGVLTFVLPVLIRKHNIVFIIIETGFTLLVVQFVESFMSDEHPALIAIITCTVIYIIGDLMSLVLHEKLTLVGIMRNFIITGSLAIFILLVDNNIFIIVFMLIAFALMMIPCEISLPIDEQMDDYITKVFGFENNEKK